MQHLTFGPYLRALRMSAGLTQVALVDAVEDGWSITQTAVSAWESDSRVPTIGQLYQLAEALGWTPGEVRRALRLAAQVEGQRRAGS